MNEQTELLKEMCELLRVIAEPILAKRDEGRRVVLRELVGKSTKNGKAVLLMDGSRSQATIRQEAGIDQGNLSRLTKALRAKELIGPSENPKLAFSIPPNFFDSREK
jgi:hypothetical protein